MAKARSIALFLSNDDEVQHAWLQEAHIAAQCHDLELHEHWSRDITAQKHQILEALRQDRHDGFVILPWTHAGPGAVLEQILEREKAVVLLARTSSDLDEHHECSWISLRKKYPRGLCATVVPDARQTGRIQAYQMKALLPAGGTILYVIGDPTSFDSTERLRGLEEVIGKDVRYAMHIVVGNFSAKLAEKACLRWLRSELAKPEGKLDLIGSQSEAMLPGIGRALAQWAEQRERPELLRLPTIAVDGTPRCKQEIDKGLLTATVETQLRVAAAIELLARYFSSGKRPREPIIELPVLSYPRLEKLSPCAPRPRPARASKAGA